MISELSSIKDEWESVYNDSATRSIFHSYNFVENFYKAFAKPEEIRILKLEADNQTVGFLPLVSLKQGSLKILNNLTTGHCLHGGTMVRTGYEKEIGKLTLDRFMNCSSEWDKIIIAWEYSFDPAIPFLTDELLNKNNLNWHRSTQPTYTIKLSQPFQNFYENQFSKKLRKNLKMYTNKLTKEGGGKYIHLRNDSALEHLDDFFAIENSGWKGEAGSSIISRGDHLRDYYTRLASQLSENDSLLISLLKHNNEFIAAVFGYVDRGIYHYSKIGFREEFSRFSPSNLLLVDIIKFLIDEWPEVNRVHLFPESAGYKQRWVNETSKTKELSIYGSSLTAKMAWSKFNLKESLKSMPLVSSIIKTVRDKARR